jgi:hypothetical protein
MQRVEIGIAVNAQDDRLAIDDEMLLSVLQCSFDNPGEALRPIVPAASNQPHPTALALHAQAITVVFDLVQPFRTGGNLCSPCWVGKIQTRQTCGVNSSTSGGFRGRKLLSVASQLQPSGKQY